MKMPGSLSSTCFLAFGLIGLMAACGSPNPINVGSTDGGTGGSGGYGGPDDTDACRNGAQLPIIGTWLGYIENFKLASGSDAVRITITSASSAQVCGKVVLGTASPLPPPTNPDVGYPPNYGERFGGLGGDRRTIDMTEGFPMTIINGTGTSERLTLNADWHQFWQSWCALQKPTCLENSDLCFCVPRGPGGAAPGYCYIEVDGGPVEFECGKLALCMSGACICTATTCRVEPSPALIFDVHVTGDKASGSVNFADNGRTEFHNIYLTRTK